MTSQTNVPLAAGILLGVVIVCFLRLMIVFRSLGKVKPKCVGRLKTLIVAGSGGHTTEILRLLSSLSDNYAPRVYILANTDKMSKDKIKAFEDSKDSKTREYIIQQIPRSREVRQSYITSILSTLYATAYAFPIIFRHAPDLVLVNGPGTCIPLCAAAFVMRFLGWKPVIQIYVESICRVQYLSVSGLIMYYFADHLMVQWPALKDKYPKAEYLGRIV
ncbi:UDP-N-acetylglucosamine transferase subunit ALG14-like [Diadema setosum]|uniref:UDP-N-acetylglucosamine transferase subunit ALG14-like n=1 Tax=Diadema setosum TaxID=31175 RepID=UPI003B3ADA96